MKLRKFLSLLLCLCLCMAVSLLPVTALAAGDAAVKYINATDDGSGDPTFEFADVKGDRTIAVFINGAADDTYTTAADDAGLLLLIDNAAVTVGESGVPGEFRLSGTAQIKLPTYTVTAGNCPALTGDASDIYNVVGFYTSAHYDGEGETPATAVYSYTVTADTELDDFLTAYDLTIQSGNTLTINAPSGADAPDYYRLTVTHALNVSGTLTAAEGQTLEIGENATVTGSGLNLYYSDGIHAYTLPATHDTVEFTSTNTGTVESPVYRWICDTDVPTYTITASAGEHGAITATATVTHGDSKSFEVTANSGYVIDTLTVDGSAEPAAAHESTYTYTFPSVTAAHTIAATFIHVYTITASAGEHGTITATATVAQGGSMDFTATAYSGYVIDTLTVDGSAEQPAAANESTYTYTFSSVVTSHSVNVTFKADPYYAPTAAIKARHWAYYTSEGTVEAMKTVFVTELWDMLSHEYPGVFAQDEDGVAIEGKISMTALTGMITVGTIQSDSGIVGLDSYYPYTISFPDRDGFSGKLYVLEAANQFVVVTTVSGTDSFNIISAVDNAESVLVRDYDEGGIEVFGNYVAAVGTLGSTDASAAWHITPHFPVANAINCTLVIYKPTFAGAKFTRSGDGGRAAAWDFGNYPFASFTGTSTTTPAEFKTFFGDGSVSFGIPSGTSITEITSVTTSLPEGAVTITPNGSGFTVAFNSNFYDEVPLTVNYTTSTGIGTGYILIKRVGIDIQGYRKVGDAVNNDLTLLHGTQTVSPSYTDFYESNQCGVFATFYYPTGTSANQVELIATYTWADGTVTRQTISTHCRTEAGEFFVACDDFQLYAGTRAGLPDKIEVTAVKTGSDSASFAGASLGRGTGVVWVKPDDFNG